MESANANQYLTFTLNDEQYAIGVAKVREVVEIDEGAIEGAPRSGARLSADFFRGIGRRVKFFKILLDIDRVFNAEEVSLLSAEAPRDGVPAPVKVEAAMASAEAGF
ncbi:MAG: chemotaxis protein CheW [Spirochaetota bacterium]